MRAREVNFKHYQGANGLEIKEVIFEFCRAPPLGTKSLGWMTRESRARAAVAFDGDTPKKFTDALHIVDSLKERRLTISLDDRREYMRKWGN